MGILRSLRAHLLALALATITPGIILLGYLVNEAAQHSMAETKAALRTLAQVAAASSSRFIAGNRESMELFARRPLVKLVDRRQCDPVMHDFRNLFPRFANLTTIALDGTAVCSAVPQPGGKPVNVYQTDWFQHALKERRFLAGNPFTGPITGRKVSVLTVPIVNDRDELTGFVGLPLDLNLYAPDLGNAQLVPGSRIGILNAEGYLIWRNEDQEGLVGKNLGRLPIVRKTIAVGDGNFEGTGTDGIPRIFSVAPIPEADWYVYVGIPVSELNARARAATSLIMIYGSAGLLIAFGLATWLAHRIAKPISNISDAAQAIKAGDIAIRAPLAGPREVIEVAIDFNTMVDAWATSLKELEFRANHDVLTGLPNRLLLADRMMQAIKRTKRDKTLLAVCFLDLDNFKPVNDQHGHTAGDQLLIEVGRRIGLVLRSDDTVARLGGDEFVLIINNLKNVIEIEQALLRLLEALNAPYHVDEEEIGLSASIGVAVYPLDDNDPDTLLRHADHAMYVAKQSGKNQISFFDTEQEGRLREMQKLRDEVRLALERHEFVLHYQPKVNLRTGEVVGAEALVRWQHPQHGLMMPGQFLPAIEDTHMIVALGDWVLSDAFRQVDSWRQEGLSLSVSINVAALQLQDEDFVRKLVELLARYPQVAPGLIELEILESAALADVKSVGRIMARCKDIGIDFALDDFGTGYSSLSYLKQLPAAILKIDQSFIRDMTENPDSLAITEGILGLARAFQRVSVAEGVETVKHGVFLLQMGCDLAQGYGIARPMPADGFAAWVEGYRPNPEWTTAGSVSWRREDFPLLAMEAEHRRWVARMIEIVESGETASAPQHVEDANTCHFGHWYRTDGFVHYSHLPEFRAIAPLHVKVHRLAGEMIELLRQRRHHDARSKIAELHQARDEVLAALQQLQDIVYHSQDM